MSEIASFVRICHYGILSSTAKIKSIPVIRSQFPGCTAPPMDDARQTEPYQKGICPHCKTATMLTLEIMPTRSAPQMKSSTKIFENKTEK